MSCKFYSIAYYPHIFQGQLDYGDSLLSTLKVRSGIK
ncbi:MAG: hypothetical protein ACI9IT_000743 [Glaciecola sp.]|jgi:hypothetical protein